MGLHLTKKPMAMLSSRRQRSVKLASGGTYFFFGIELALNSNSKSIPHARFGRRIQLAPLPWDLGDSDYDVF